MRDYMYKYFFQDFLTGHSNKIAAHKPKSTTRDLCTHTNLSRNDRLGEAPLPFALIRFFIGSRQLITQL